MQGHGEVLDELLVDGMRIVDVVHPSALCLGRHLHDTAKLRILLDGADTERRGLEVSTAAPLLPIFRRAFEPHENQYHVLGARSLLVEMDPDDSRARRAGEGALDGDLEEGRTLGARIFTAFRARASSRARLVLAAVDATLDAFGARKRRPVPAWLEAAREILVARADRPPSLDELGSALGVHPIYLAQSFRKRWGLSTRAFVRAHRVFRAIEQIKLGATLADAAIAAGFADQSHMTRAIRAARGAPPKTLLTPRFLPRWAQGERTKLPQC